MAVEDFLNPSKIKIKKTIEKPVKQKPKTSELITIEKPGREISKDEIPEERKTRKRKIKRAKSTKIKISKMIIFVIPSYNEEENIGVLLDNTKKNGRDGV